MSNKNLWLEDFEKQLDDFSPFAAIEKDLIEALGTKTMKDIDLYYNLKIHDFSLKNIYNETILIPKTNRYKKKIQSAPRNLSTIYNLLTANCKEFIAEYKKSYEENRTLYTINDVLLGKIPLHYLSSDTIVDGIMSTDLYKLKGEQLINIDKIAENDVFKKSLMQQKIIKKIEADYLEPLNIHTLMIRIMYFNYGKIEQLEFFNTLIQNDYNNKNLRAFIKAMHELDEDEREQYYDMFNFSFFRNLIIIIKQNNKLNSETRALEFFYKFSKNKANYDSFYQYAKFINKNSTEKDLFKKSFKEDFIQKLYFYMLANQSKIYEDEYIFSDFIQFFNDFTKKSDKNKFRTYYLKLLVKIAKTMTMFKNIFNKH